MPRFVPNPNAGSTLMYVAPEDTYTFSIGKPETFEIDNTEKGGKHSWGIKYPLRIIGGTEDGKKMASPVNLYLHTENTNNINIVFLMAALGFMPGDAAAEQEYKDLTADWDWSFDTDTKEVGSGWQKLENNQIMNEVSVQIIEQGTRMGQQQNVLSLQWKPVGS